MSADVAANYERGMRFLLARQKLLVNGKVPSMTWLELATIGRDGNARQLRDRLSTQLGVEKGTLLQNAQFAAAVETIVDNCGEYARKLLLETTAQFRTSIMRLSRTADTRQRYRIEGVRSGRFRSVAPQKSDSVYDTVSFSEVSSRLRRGRGTLRELAEALVGEVDRAVVAECQRLAKLCRQSAIVLQRFVRMRQTTTVAIPHGLLRSAIKPGLERRDVRGHIVGKGRLALAMIIKSVWDYPEMRNRGILPTDAERECTIRETNEIISIAKAIDETLRTLDLQR